MSVSMIPPEGGVGEAGSAAGPPDECGAVEERSAMGADDPPSDRIGVIVSPPSKPEYCQRFVGSMVPAARRETFRVGSWRDICYIVVG